MDNTFKSYGLKQKGGRLERYDYDAGPLKANEVELKVLYCGLCHSDVSYLNNDWGMSTYPVVAGHEAIGRVARVGPLVTKHKEGDLVGVGGQSGYCMTCPQCLGGDHNLCPDQKITISTGGGFAGRMRAQEAAVVAIPDGIDPKDAGPLLCAGITVFNPLVQYDVRPTSSVAVIGIGGLGHLALQFLKAWGCRVTAFTSSESKKKEALAFGASDTINSRDADAVKGATARFDLILSTVNVKLDWPLYLTTLKPKGRLHFLGILVEPIAVPMSTLLFSQLEISSSPMGSPETLRKMMQFAALHKIKPAIEVFKISQINEAIEKVEKNSVRYRAVVDCSELH